jgi:hypothetical protein
VHCRYTAISSQRFSSVTQISNSSDDANGGGGGLAIALTGATGERVTITALQRASNADGRLATTKSGAAYKVAVKTVTIAANGTATLAFP